ncbi:MAG: HlyD family efflux transporter periplasmic adaptor subunit [Planctomycetaceae bacterium]|jgi:multidrug efflux pump subunit AcrA (membrane-fusion protein)|nr:HlyD family efflux transporter periplasmic adaptor subunit [Planctomycetaceae bacterium]
MYNTLILISLLPFSGPEAGEHLAAIPRPAAISSIERADVAEQIPVLPSSPKRQIASYPPELPATVSPTPLQLAQHQTLPPATAAPAVSETMTPFAQQQRDPNSVRVTGILEVPKRNHVILAAAYQSVLVSLKTEQRNADGNIATESDGKPVLIPIIEGMQVFKDQVLGSFDDRELQCNLEISQCKLDVAVAEREKKIEVEYAAWSYRVAEAELQMLKETNKLHEKAIAQIEVNKALLALQQAEANLRLQKYTLEEIKAREVTVSEREVTKTKVLIELRKLIAPIDGMIVRIDKAEGEWLREGDPVLEIMQLNTLRARCKVSAKYYTPDMVDGKNVTVSMPMVNGRTEEFPGKVVFAHPKVEAGDWFEVFIEVENRPSGRSWLLQPGRDVAAVIHL